MGSIALHLCLEFDYRAESYAEALAYLEKKGLLKHPRDLIGIVRLRNLLVHKYWTIDDSRVYDSIKKNFKQVENFLKNIEKWLK